MREMFSSIAPKYDFITRMFSFGMDQHWKRLAIRFAALGAQPRVLDLACGTGDFSKLLADRDPGSRSVAVDLTERMLRLAASEGVTNPVCADAGSLPFPDRSFDCVFVGYGLRNFSSLKHAVLEIERVTRPGGLLVSLDFFLPANRCLRELYLGYLFLQGAFWGLLLHGRPRTYTYIPDSLRSFLSIDQFSALLRNAGYENVAARSFILGGIALHWARK